MYGGDGSDTFVFAGSFLGSDVANEALGATGRDTLDFSELAGPVTLDMRLAGPQVVNPTHLTLTLVDPNAFEDVFGSAFGNNIEGNDNDNHIVGGAGDDILHGHGGNDYLEGRGGNDELYGEEGNDTLDGGTGNDVLLGDTGLVRGLYNPDGTRMLNPDGSWRKDVLLLDPARVVSDRVVSANAPIDSSLLGQEVWLLTGVQDSKGKWQTHLLVLDLYAAGNDTLLGGDGNDVLLGQRGNDSLDGGAGNDYLEGNEGNDSIHGGAGNDILIGDNSYNFVGSKDALPLVLHGYELNPQTTAAPGVLPKRGAMVVPLAFLMPAGVDTIDPFGSALYEGVRQSVLLQGLTPYTGADGRVQTVFAVIVPSVGGHTDLLPGNDSLFGDAGDDRLVGDTNALIAPFQSGLQGLLDDLGNVSDRLAWLEKVLTPAPTTVARVGSDTLDGGDGNDMLIGDDNLVLAASAGTTGDLPAGLAQAADDLEDGVNAFANKVKGKPGAASFTNGADTLSGGDGNDLLIGDSNVAIGLALEGPIGSPGSGWLCNVRLDSLSIQGGQDTLSGDSGNDQLIGDSQLSVLLSIGGNPFTALDGVSIGPDAQELLAVSQTGAQMPVHVSFAGNVLPFLPVISASAGTGSTGYHTVDVDSILCQIILTGGKDNLDGGTGDDTLVGDNQLLVAAVVQGPLANPVPGTAAPDRQLVDIDGLVGCVQLNGAADTLAGGDGNDVLVGDDQVIVTAVLEGPAVQIGSGQAAARVKCTSCDALVQFDGLIDQLSLQGANDQLQGGAGDDTLIGDEHVLVGGMVIGPVLLGSDGATGYMSEYAFETTVEFNQLVDSLNLCGGDDTLHGGDGSDLLVGDSSILLVELLRGPVVSGPAAFIGQAAYAAPFTGSLVDFDGLVDSVSSSGGRDTLFGEAGDDSLIGDDQLAVAGIVEGALAQAGSGTITLPAKRSYSPDMVDFDGLVNCVQLCGGSDTLDGGPGSDLLVGDNAANVGAVITGGAGAPISLPSSLMLKMELNQLVGSLCLSAQKDVLSGADGNDTLVGDQELGIADVIAGGQPQDAAIIDMDSLAGRITLDASDDRLDGGAGDDLLIGDSRAAVTGLLLAGAGTTGNRDISSEDLLCSLCLDAGADTLTGGDGNDTAFGDNAASLAGVMLADAGVSAVQSTVEISGLVGSVTIAAGRDTLDGGAGNNDLYGDNDLLLTDVGGRLDAGALRIQIDCGLVGSVSVDGNNDSLTGGDGSDRLTGDNRIEMAGMAGSVAAGAALQVVIDELVENVCVGAGSDALWGGLGDDQLTGDNFAVLAGLAVRGPVGGSLTLTVEDQLTDSLSLGAGCCDQLDGSDGNDVLVGDQAFSIGAVLDAGGRSGTAAAPTGAVVLNIEGLASCVDVEAGGDTLTGDNGNDLLVGDSRTVVAGFLGSFSDPIGAAATLSGDRLVSGLDIDAGGDTLRGGDGDDTLVGDSDTVAALFAGGAAAPSGANVMKTFVDNLWVDSCGDSLSGDAGTNVKVTGNRASTPSSLVRCASISDRSSSAPAPLASIDWLGFLAGL
jgi:Ca2+-binding RTX toxin-like protein